MAQKNISTTDQENKTTFTDIGVIGTFGNYFEDIWRAGATESTCGSSHTILDPIGVQKKTFRHGGIDVSYNTWQGKYEKNIYGARGLFGVESGGITADYPGSNFSFALNPYAMWDRQYYGIGIGLLLGQIKTPENDYRSSTYRLGVVVSRSYRNAAFLPSITLRGGPVDILYAEMSSRGSFYSITPSFPPIIVGLGSGLGKTNGTKVVIGGSFESGAFNNGSNKGIYGQIAYPIRNKLILEAFYWDNLHGGEYSKNVFSLGIHYRFSPGKSISK